MRNCVSPFGKSLTFPRSYLILCRPRLIFKAGPVFYRLLGTGRPSVPPPRFYRGHLKHWEGAAPTAYPEAVPSFSYGPDTGRPCGESGSSPFYCRGQSQTGPPSMRKFPGYGVSGKPLPLRVSRSSPKFWQGSPLGLPPEYAPGRLLGQARRGTRITPAARRRRNLPAYNERNPKSAPSSGPSGHLPPGEEAS